MSANSFRPLAALVLMASSVAIAQNAAPPSESEVRDALQEAGVRTEGLLLSVDDDIVTLSGSIDDEIMQTRIIEVVESMAGIAGVVNTMVQ